MVKRCLMAAEKGVMLAFSLVDMSDAGPERTMLGVFRSRRSWLQVQAPLAALCTVPQDLGPVWLQLVIHLYGLSAVCR